MRRLISYMFTSLDGYVADRDGGLGWTPIDAELMRFANGFFADADGIVFGRNVFEGFTAFWDGLDPTDPSIAEHDVAFAEIFRRMERIVVSRTLAARNGATLIADDAAAGVAALKDRPGRDLLLICGPELRSTLARAGLIDRYLVLVAPIVLGTGIEQFADDGDPLQLRLNGTRVFEGGVILLELEPAERMET